MNAPFRILATVSLVILASCAPSRTPFSPDGPRTVGMPSKLSERERLFIPDIDSALRRDGLIPVGNGKGDMQLDFSISEGPIHTDTDISLNENTQILASGHGRAAGVPMIGRSSVAQKSFDAAFTTFDAELARVASRRGWSNSSSSYNDAAEPPAYQSEDLPVY